MYIHAHIHTCSYLIANAIILYMCTQLFMCVKVLVFVCVCVLACVSVVVFIATRCYACLLWCVDVISCSVCFPLCLAAHSKPQQRVGTRGTSYLREQFRRKFPCVFSRQTNRRAEFGS